MMTDLEKLQYAKARLGLARLMGDTEEVEKWREHVKYFEAAQQSVQPTGLCPYLRVLRNAQRLTQTVRPLHKKGKVYHE